jgi:TetR/AcrR family transcriptional repressor of nem operon
MSTLDRPEARKLTRKGQATRDRIVEATARLIGERGVAATGVEDIRAAAGVSGSQLYHYFDSKRSLIRAVIATQAAAVINAQTSTLGALDSFDALRAWADASIDIHERRADDHVCDLTVLAGGLDASEEESRTDLADGFGRWVALIREGLELMRERGDLRPEADPERLSLALLAALQGGLLLARTMDDSLPLHAALDGAVAYVHTWATDPDLRSERLPTDRS